MEWKVTYNKKHLNIVTEAIFTFSLVMSAKSCFDRILSENRASDMSCWSNNKYFSDFDNENSLTSQKLNDNNYTLL
jgi:hypothetical protein